MELKDIFAKVYDYLASNDLIVGQEDLAVKMGTTPTTISRIKHGMVKKISEKNIKKLNASFGDVFNPDFLRGKSDVMFAENVKNRTLHNFTQEPKIDQGSLVNAAIAGYETAITELRGKVRAKEEVIAEKNERLKEKENTIASKEETINSLRSEIATKSAYIKSLEQQVANLKATIASLKTKDNIDKYPFVIGVADEGERPSAIK